MSYRPPPEDKDPGSVKSLLSILRAQQDAPQPAPPPPSRSTQRQIATPRYPWLPRPQDNTVEVPSNQDLKSLLAALNPTIPIGNSGISHPKPAVVPTPATPIKPIAPTTTSQPPSPPKRRTIETSSEHRNLPLNKALPLITSLLSDDNVIKELRKLKSRQDAIEKTLWKKRQDIMSQHAKRMEASFHTAHILGAKTISAQEEKVQKAWLDRALSTFYTKECLPAFDEQRREQLSKIQELGIPGMGEDDNDEKTIAKRRRIVDFLDGMLSED